MNHLLIKWSCLLSLSVSALLAGGDVAPLPSQEKSLINAISLSYGQSKDTIDIYRFGLQRDFQSRWFQSGVGYLSGYYELSLNYWNGRGEQNFGIALSPVFAYYFQASKDFKPYLEGGIGASLFSRTKMGPRDLSSNYLFEDRIGMGFRTKNWNLAFRYMHYSNAGIKQPNSGIDIFLASVAYRF